MMERLAVDTNAVIDLLRGNRPDPPQLREADSVVIPITVFGELLAGAHGSARVAENLAAIEGFVASRETLMLDANTARVYGRLRGRIAKELTQRKVNDLWIAALCVQHDLPLLTNDRGFDAIRELTAIHW